MMRRKSTGRGRGNRQPQVVANSRIRYDQVRVLSEGGEQLGVMSSREAYFKAQEMGTDLVLVTDKAQPPVVRIIDLAKHKYQLQQREAEQRKKAKAQDIKELRFSPFMAEGDFEARLKRAKEFLQKGDKVRLQLQFKGRAITKKEFGYELFQRVFDETAEIAEVEIVPKMVGKKLIAQLNPTKQKKS